MNRKLGIAIGLMVTVAAASGGCTDVSTPTGAPVPQTFFSQAPVPGFDVLKRTAPLAGELRVSGIIGAEGGELSLREAGVTLVFPEGALSRPTRIEINAYAGDDVAFDFQPHGTRFARPVSVLLDTRGTSARDLEPTDYDDLENVPLFRHVAVYFEGDPRLGAVTPLEVLPMDLRQGKLHFAINHFSGYASASN